MKPTVREREIEKKFLAEFANPYTILPNNLGYQFREYLKSYRMELAKAIKNYGVTNA